MSRLVTRAGAHVPSPAVGAGTPFWTMSVADALAATSSAATGLGAAEAAGRLARVGPNTIAAAGRTTDVGLLVRQFESPIVLILVFATVISGVLGDTTDATIILAIIALSGLLGFWQERGATRAVADLLAVVQVKVATRWFYRAPVSPPVDTR